MDSLASRLRKARTEKGLTQTQLAASAGVAQSTVGNIESGDRGGAASLALLAEALGVRYRWLRDGDGEQAVAVPAECALSPALRARINELDDDSLRRIENVLRAHLDMEPVSKVEALSGKRLRQAA